MSETTEVKEKMVKWRVYEQGDANEFCLVGDDERWVIAFRLNGELYREEQKQIIDTIIAALSGTTSDTLIADAVKAEREACERAAAAAPVRCAHVTCHACPNPAAAAIRARTNTEKK